MFLRRRSALRPGVKIFHRRRDWIAGLRWEPLRGNVSFLMCGKKYPDTHGIVVGRRIAAMAGFVSPGRVRRSMYSLAVAFQLAEGENAWGIYRLSREQDLWVFLAVSGGQLSVMGDVTGSRAFVESAAQNFLRFNDADAPGRRCAATADDGKDATQLTDRLTRPQLRRCRLRKRLTSAAVLLSVVVITAISVAGAYWHDTVQQKAEQAAAMAAFRARQAMTREKPVTPVRAPHPWVSQPSVQALLSHCWLTRAPLYASVAGWRFDDGECVPQGLRLRYVAMPGSTVEDFSRRARELLGHAAIFNLQEGGKRGDVFIPFPKTFAPDLGEEALPSADAQLMRFISHLQRRNLDVTFTEVRPPAVAPGQVQFTPIQDWREFTFSISARLQPERLLQGFDASGLRLTSVSLTMSPQGQFHYTIKGSIYAQN
ncbi:type 4b pilus protein PilO2 [Serratia symbiotica]|uniref:Type 4b pilus protein PilO2 n=1 Tax=Serratia symbiotica TaxID=138074 RepID=A0A068YZ61_9GAMM|nr:type 4b pilus protein PilO2 [Serratia symbiotica]QLH61910.1 type 4b pilus protein PilO2 [Serratia symbiotica]CDS56556.1 putative pilin accessory protein (pilO) [Serratia symbiotica]